MLPGVTWLDKAFDSSSVLAQDVFEVADQLPQHIVVRDFLWRTARFKEC